ncbi:MAG: FecR domain-containing protein [Candidatus Competibacteraceae bacterium]|nr:FecR domain-containing protein [Candidatus Competibacteraceae bacterium]MCP5127905.1 FecR domain-containing protein [Gammaproteobacteria bacterium]HRX70929.1 FecR domain-containing protein [Candidatus Competibacteraceae bacterium]
MIREVGFSGLLLYLWLGVVMAAYSQEWIYTVRPGDNLWNITEDYLIHMNYWPRLQALNRVADPHYLPPGMKLRIPVAWLKGQPTATRVLSTQGQVRATIKFTGQTIAVDSGQLLHSGDEIRTGPDGSATLEFGDGSRLLLQADSQLVINTLNKYGEDSLMEARLSLPQGRVDNQVTTRRSPRTRYEIWTPAAVSAVRGTDYRLSMDPVAAIARTEVLKGAVEFKGSRTTRRVAQGFGARTTQGQPPGMARPLLAAPSVVNLPTEITRTPIQFSLVELPGATAYRAQIAADERFEALLFDGVASAPQVRGPDLPDGDYVLRVRGIDAQGLEGYDAYHRFRLHARPEPPFLVRPDHQATVPEKIPTFEWTESAAAVAYHFQLASDAQFAKLLLDLPDLTQSRLTPEQLLAPGVYYWRVATRDAAGRHGPFSDPQQFRLLPTPEVGPPEATGDTLVFRWSAGLPDQSYQVQLARDIHFQEIVVDQQVDKPQLAISWPESGFHYLRMRTIDPNGYVAPYGPVQRIDIPPRNYWPFGLGTILVLIIAL